ncbi:MULTISPECIES: hypothetical protein [unclassified Exiguobacterium]|uniref:hypothetical protein n=2 Tax=Exiguobacterium TaxID=33986 RepID=UPI001BE7F64B|nr:MULTISPECIES: hypothetical protein [unclassified Exiguobacterium]
MFLLPQDRKGRFIFKCILGMSLFLLFIGRSEVPLPIHATTSFVPFEIQSPTQLPFVTDSEYAHLVSLSRVELVYQNDEQSITVWATTELGWHHTETWEAYAQTIQGSPVYLNETDELTVLSWQQDGVEYAIDYKGDQLSKQDLFDIAVSMN